MGKDIRDSFFDKIYEMACENKNIIFISADADAFSLKKFKENLPDQFINVGVAEQNMALVATGLALSGKTVFIYSITSFIAMRCFEQIKVNICSMNLPVAIVGLGSGYSFSYDGPTHHATQDIAIMRTLPEIKILNPCDEKSAEHAAKECCSASSPVYVRIDKGEHNDIYGEQDCEIGLKEVSSNTKIKLISTGYMSHKMQKMNKRLLESNWFKKHNISFDLIDIYKLKPLNTKKLVEILSDADLILTVEENTSIGNLGSMMCELLVDNSIKTPLKRFSLQDSQEFRYASRDWLIENSGLDGGSIIQAIRSFIDGR